MTFETRAKFRGMILLDNEEYNKIRTKLVNLIAKINNVINSSASEYKKFRIKKPNIKKFQNKNHLINIISSLPKQTKNKNKFQTIIKIKFHN